LRMEGAPKKLTTTFESSIESSRSDGQSQKMAICIEDCYWVTF